MKRRVSIFGGPSLFFLIIGLFFFFSIQAYPDEKHPAFDLYDYVVEHLLAGESEWQIIKNLQATPEVQLPVDSPVLLPLLNHDEPKIREKANILIMHLASRQDPQTFAKKLLEVARNEKDEKVLLSLVRGLQIQKKSQETIDFVGDLLLNHESDHIRFGAARYLALIREFGSSEYLVQGLNDPSEKLSTLSCIN